MKVIYELQLPHIELATLAGKDETRRSLNCVHIDPRGYAEATDGHRLGRLTGVRWWEAVLGSPIPAGWMRHPDPILTEPPVGKSKGFKPEPKLMPFWTEGPDSAITKALAPVEHAKPGISVPRTVLETVSAAMKGKIGNGGSMTFQAYWYVGGVAGNPKKAQAVYFNRKAFTWQQVEWFLDDCGEFPDIDQVIPGTRDEAASACVNAMYLADYGKLSKGLNNRQATVRIITNHDTEELKTGADSTLPFVIQSQGQAEGTMDKLVLSGVLMPIRSPWGDYKRRSRPAMPAMAPESPQEARSEPTPAQAPSGQLAGVLLDLVERTIAAYDGEGPTKDGLKDLATVIEEARGVVMPREAVAS